MIYIFRRIATVHEIRISFDKLKYHVYERDLENFEPFARCKPERGQSFYTRQCNNVRWKTSQVVSYFSHFVQLAFLKSRSHSLILGQVVDSLSTARACFFFDKPFENARAAEGMSTAQYFFFFVYCI